MDIWTPPSTTVVYHGNGGYEHDKQHANQHLEIGKQYTVYCVDVGSSSSKVELVELPGVRFNTVLFDNIEGYDENNPYSQRIEREWNKYYFG